MVTTTPGLRANPRRLLNKVPEVTLWFWIIKILCTTVGESFADYVNETLGVGLVPTTVLFSVVLAVVLTTQLRLARYVPAVYWSTVVVVSVTGTLYTDILTDQVGVPLWVSTTVFTLLLVGVFGVWFARERTLSIHSIVTTPREAFYWLAVLVTFALGTATGDWTLELTGWGPGTSVLLPLSLIAVVVVLWRYGANPVLSFWLAYVLTRPLGANIGDWLATPSSEKGLGLGTFGTSLVFLAAILVTVVYLSVSKVDVIEGAEPATTDAARHPAPTRPPSTEKQRARERVGLAAFVVVGLATFGLLAYANSQPHTSSLDEEEGGAAASCSGGGDLTATAAAQRAATSFPADDVSAFRQIADATRSLVQQGDQAGAASRITDLETAWDDAEPRLSNADCGAWTYLDHEIDASLSAVRASSPDQQSETQALDALITTLG
ncbi:hypothetical protein GCM10023340_09390 [Nocardioides marinquilinus]|uniref:Membrane-anchored protein n=1 Tax=Nocardioides marinquilinus TaxID=1210400 RepID=A0ABP9PCN6_9ACTN